MLFLTARDAVSDKVRRLDTGADDYLCKPFDYDELLARVRPWCGGRPSRAAPCWPLPTSAWTWPPTGPSGPASGWISPPRSNLSWSSSSATPRKCSHARRIYEHVWEERYDGLSNTLEVHVMELRRKLEAHGPRLIHTLRGRGYLFGERAEPGPLP